MTGIVVAAGLLGLPAGLSFDYDGHTAPPGSVLSYGQAISRTTYAALYAAITLQLTGNRTSGSAVITGLSATEQLEVGAAVEGTGIPASTTIASVDSATQVTLSANATSGSGTATALRFFPHGGGNGSTTFNVPDKRSRASFGRDNMGGSAASRITSGATGIRAQGIGQTGGGQTVTLTTTEMPAHAHPGSTTTAVAFTGGGTDGPTGGTGSQAAGAVTVASQGGGGATNKMPPTIIVNKIITTGGV